MDEFVRIMGELAAIDAKIEHNQRFLSFVKLEYEHAMEGMRTFRSDHNAVFLQCDAKGATVAVWPDPEGRLTARYKDLEEQIVLRGQQRDAATTMGRDLNKQRKDILSKAHLHLSDHPELGIQTMF